ncbi:MAG: hypothetical protein ACXWWU_00470 [Candidatus Limnocylindria bacterium]
MRLARLLAALTLSLPLVATSPGHVLAEGSRTSRSGCATRG